MTTDHTMGRSSKLVWVTLGIIAFVALWLPASWLANRMVPIDWPTEGQSGQAVVDRLNRQIWTNYLFGYATWVVLWLLVTLLARAVRRKFSGHAPSATGKLTGNRPTPNRPSTHHDPPPA